MYKLTTVQTRPSTSVDFWTRDNPAVTAEYLLYNKDTYIVPGKLLNADTTISEDGLTMTTSLIWASQEDSDAWRTDPVVQEQFVQLMKSYHADNGITVVRTEETI
jgi:hypothetical protein